MFWKKEKRGKQEKRMEYDPAVVRPVLRCSICNGEQVAGFKNLQTGKFEEAALITSPKELEDFMRLYGITEMEKEY